MNTLDRNINKQFFNNNTLSVQPCPSMSRENNNLVALRKTKLFKNHQKSQKEVELKINLTNTLNNKKQKFQENLDKYLELENTISESTNETYKEKLKHRQRNIAYSNRCLDADITELSLLIK